MATDNGLNVPRLLLVEGRFDQAIVEFMKENEKKLYGVKFCIRSMGGLKNLDEIATNKLRSLIVSPISVAIGLVVDADRDFVERWNFMSSTLNATVDIDMPALPDRNGWIDESMEPHIGLWVMPDNQKDGQIENMLSDMIPSDDYVWGAAQRYIESLVKDEENIFDTQNIPKANIAAWIAAQEKPGDIKAAFANAALRRTGESRAFVSWLRRLFSDELPQA